MNYYSLVSERKFKLKVPHYIGESPNKNGTEKKTLMPIAGIVVIEEREGAFYLDRYNFEGEWAGETWHKTIDDARYQAKFEYGDSLIKWVEIPDSVSDSVEYALEAARKN